MSSTVRHPKLDFHSFGNGNGKGWPRRDFLKAAGLAVGALGFQPWRVMAGPFSRKDFNKLVPADKKLFREWVKSLFARGEPEVLRRGDLKFVGMPVGGIGAGQLYLGGDGRLWHWDIFNQVIGTGAEHYAKPMSPESPLKQRFALRIGGKLIPLDSIGFSDVRFLGQYPIGNVKYADGAVPLTVELNAFSPFIPLNTDDSSLPATIMQFTLRNVSNAPVEASIFGEMENAVCLNNRWQSGVLRNKIAREPGISMLVCSAEPAPPEANPRPDIVFEDWNKDTYDGWTVEGAAFGNGPVKKKDIPAYQGDVGGDTERVANSHASAPATTLEERDNKLGKLTSREFVIDRHFVNFWIGGGRARSGSHLGLSLVIDGKVVHTASGRDSNEMARGHFNVLPFEGKTAHFEIIDDAMGGWGHTGVGRIVLSDTVTNAAALPNLPDYGTMTLALLGNAADEASADATASFDKNLSGFIGRKFTLAPSEETKVTFLITWHFPNLSLRGPLENAGQYYATKFASAPDVARYVSKNFTRLSNQTWLWRETWYDSTLPYWFLDRTFLNACILASSTTHRFANGRYYGWEGVGCCEGTCGHVYHYAHATARLFPELERTTREHIDFGQSLQPNGAIFFRGEFNDFPAVDGQSGTILRALREHQMSANSEFLKRTWPKIKLATQWLIGKDANNDGIIESNQHNTLDTDWFGPVAWLSGLYLAALSASAAMADEVGDADFARQCRTILEAGQKNLVKELFNGEYFINRVDPKHLDAINSGTGCEIDQVFGQSWSFQVGLPRLLPKKETVSALKALWRCNFSPDCGHYRDTYKPGRWYAMAGEAGLLMCSFPQQDWDYAQAKGKGPDFAAGYFNECMNGFEYQVAGHMIWEGLLLEGFAVTRALHDRYHASRRNPWNEVECGDHYARSMASYGVYLAACGFEYHGPKQHIGFDPRLTPKDFKCAFTSAEGWGTFTQKVASSADEAEIHVRWGKAKLKSVALRWPERHSHKVTAELLGLDVPVRVERAGERLMISLVDGVEIPTGQSLKIRYGKPKANHMSSREIATVEAFIAAINQRDVNAIANLMTPDHTFIDSTGTPHTGRDAMTEGWKYYFATFPDYEIHAERILGDKSVVAVFGSAVGTFKGKRGLVAENRIAMPAAWRALVENGKVKLWQVYADWTEGNKIMEQDKASS